MKYFKTYEAYRYGVNGVGSLKNSLAALKRQNITGRYVDPETLAQGIRNEYEAITGEKYEDEVQMSMDNTIADIIGHYKLDGPDFMAAWDKVVKESVNENEIKVGDIVYRKFPGEDSSQTFKVISISGRKAKLKDNKTGKQNGMYLSDLVKESLNEAKDSVHIKKLTDTFDKFKLPKKYEIMMDSLFGGGSKIAVLRKRNTYGGGAMIDTHRKDGGSNYEGFIEILSSRSGRPIPGKSKFDNIDDAMQAATKFVDSIKESVNEGSDQQRLTHLRKFGIAPNNQPQNAAYIKQVSKPGKFFVDWKDAFNLGDVALEFIKSVGSISEFDIIDLKTMKRTGKQLDVKKGQLGNLRTTYGVRVNESVTDASNNLEKIFGTDQETMDMFQGIEDKGTIKDMIEFIDEFGNEEMLSRYGIKSSAQVKKLAKTIMNESYKGNFTDFKYDLEMAIDNMDISPKAIKSVKKKGKGYEVRLSSYMSDKSTWEKIGDTIGATLISFKPGSINIGIYE